MINLSTEKFGKSAKVAENFWIIQTRHNPGLSKNMFEIGNRTLVFRLRNKETGQYELMAFNATDPTQAFAAVHEIERESGLALRYLISPGGGHLIHLSNWHSEFPEAKILIPPVRIHRTYTGGKLITLPRVEKLPLEHSLPQFKDDIDVVIFHGLLGIKDIRSAGEGGSDSPLQGLRIMWHIMFNVKDPIDEVWLYHKPTKTIIAGENLGWFYPKDVLAKQPMMLKMMLKPDKLLVQTMPRKVADKDTVRACWAHILNWEADTVMTYHEQPGIAFRGNGQAALREAARAAKQI